MQNSKLLTYEYFKIPHREIDNRQSIVEVFSPFIPVRISCNKRLSLQFRALVDSGSTRVLLPGALGIQIGINILGGKPVKISGIGYREITAYTHKINIHLGLITFETEADFSFEEGIPLLGRNGFFNLFQKVIFDENFHTLQLVMKTRD